MSRFSRAGRQGELVMHLPGFQLAGMQLKEYKVDCGHGQHTRLFYQSG